MKKNLKRILFIPVVLLLCLGLGMAITYFTQYNGQPFDFMSLLKGQYTIIPVVAGGALYIIYVLNKLTDPQSSSSVEKLSSKTKEGKSVSQFYDSRWITEKELRTEKKFMYNDWNSIRNATDGILIRNELKGGHLNINMYKPIHTMIIGTTGTGKTSKYIEPSIQVLSSTKTKPSFIITDPKGELYEKESHKLREEGYDVMVFNLRQPYNSTRWNPLDNAYVLFTEAHHLHEKVKTHFGINPADLGLKIISKEYNHEWYEFDGVAYPNKEVLDNELGAKKEEMIDQAENSLKEIAACLCPIVNKNDSSWERGAQEFVFGTLLAMLEDTLDDRLNMTREKFNLYNFVKIANYKDLDKNEPYRTLKQYFQNRDEHSKVMQLVSTAIFNSPTTSQNYMGIMTAAIDFLNDKGISFATSENEMKFDTFADRPTALFIIIPDEKENRHSIATMLISQLYQKLVSIAAKYPGNILPRRVYYLLDEFPNLPKIEKIDSMVTVSRSRDIFFSFVLQSFSQLNHKYGDNVAEILKGSCPIKIFIGTDDQKTIDEFSKLCGDITIQTSSVTESKGQKDEKGKENSTGSTSFSNTSRPLIYPDELSHISRPDGTGEMIIKILSEFPIRTFSTPAYMTPMFDHTLIPPSYSPARYLNEDAIYYDIAQRNRIVQRDNDDF